MVEARRKVGQRSFPECLYMRSPKSVHLLHIHPSSTYPLQMGSQHPTCLYKCIVGCVQYMHVCVCFACVARHDFWGLTSGWGSPYGPISRFPHSPKNKSLNTLSYTETHTLGYLSTEVTDCVAHVLPCFQHNFSPPIPNDLNGVTPKA